MNAWNNLVSLRLGAAALATLALTLGAASAHAGTWVKRSSVIDISACPTGYVPVAAYTLPDAVTVPGFCVMKFEAKKSSAVPGDRVIVGSASALTSSNAYPISLADGTPWVNLTWQDAKKACASTAGSQLITETQWLSIAHQVAGVASNWSGGSVGSGFLYSGHNDNAPAAALAASADSDGYFGTGDSESSPGDSAFNNFSSNTAGAYQGQRRTLTLPNGSVVWDMAGNVWEWTDATIAIASRYHGGTGAWMAYHTTEGGFTAATSVPLAKRPPFTYNATQGMGRYYDGASAAGAYNSISEAPANCTGYCDPTAAFMRGGIWGDGAYTGVFTLELSLGRSYVGSNIGFRCTR